MDENNVIARFNRGLLRAQVADNNRAIRDFDKVIELQPDNNIAYLNRAVLNNEIGNSSGALSDLNSVLESHPDYFTGYYMRSQIKRELNDLKGAERDYNIARNLEANAHSVATSKPELLADAGVNAEKKETRDQTDQDIEKFNLLVTAGDDTKQDSKYQRQSRGRVQNINAPVELEPKFVLTYYEKEFDVRRPVYYSDVMERANNSMSLSWILKVTNNEAPLNEMQIQQHFRSINNYSGRIESDPSNVALYFGRGMDFMQIQDYESALKDMSKVIELEPDLLLGHFARALIRTNQLEYDYKLSDEYLFSDNRKAGSTFQGEIAGVPKLPDISVKSVHYEEILREYDKIIKINPDFIYAYYNRAEIFSIEKDFRAAISDYTKAIEIEPQFAEAYFNRGISRLSIGETSAGLDDLRKAGELGIVQSYSIIKRMQ